MSIVIMRRRRTMNFVVACWLLGRSLFLLVFFIEKACENPRHPVGG
jgi:hypothetical protein